MDIFFISAQNYHVPFDNFWQMRPIRKILLRTMEMSLYGHPNDCTLSDSICHSTFRNSSIGCLHHFLFSPTNKLICMKQFFLFPLQRLLKPVKRINKVGIIWKQMVFSLLILVHNLGSVSC